MSDDKNPSQASMKNEGSLKDPEKNTGSEDIPVAPSEHSISDASTSRAATGPLHSFNPSPCTGPGSSGVDVASSEVSFMLRYDPSRSVATELLIFNISITVGRKRGRTRGR